MCYFLFCGVFSIYKKKTKLCSGQKLVVKLTVMQEGHQLKSCLGHHISQDRRWRKRRGKRRQKEEEGKGEDWKKKESQAAELPVV